MTELSNNHSNEQRHTRGTESAVDPLPDQTIEIDGDSNNPLDAVIDRWIDDRTQLVFSRNGNGDIPHKKIADLDNKLVQELSGLIPGGDQSQVLSCLMRHAQDRCYWAEQELVVTRVEEGSTIREEIEAKIIDRWQEIGWYRAQRNGGETVADLEEPYFKQKRQFFSDMLTRQFEQLIGGNTGAVRKIVDESIDGISRKAEQIGVRRYVEAERIAIELYKNFPGRAKNSHELFTTLAKLTTEQREDALRAFEGVFGDSFNSSFEFASNNILSQLKNFAKIPALKAALEERFGIGVGLLKAGGHIIPQPKNLLSAIGGWAKNKVIFCIGVWKVLIPRLPSLKSFKKWSTLKEESIGIWKEYTGQLLSFLTDLTSRAAKPQELRINALLAGDKVEACVHSCLLLLWEDDEKMREVLVSLLSELTPEERKEVEEQFYERYNSQVGGRTLREALTLNLSEEDAGVIEAYLDGNPELAFSRTLDSKLAKSRKTRVELLQELSQRSPDELKKIAARFREDHDNSPDPKSLYQNLKGLFVDRVKSLFNGRSIKEDHDIALDRKYLSQYLKGPLLDWAESLFDGRPIDAAAARLQCALKGISREWPEVIFYDHEHHERRDIIARTEQLYDIDFWKQARKARGQEATEILKVFIEKGELELFYQVRHCLISHVKDVDSLKALLFDRRPKRIEQMTEKYNATFSRRDFSPPSLMNASISSTVTLLRTGNLEKAGTTFTKMTTVQRDLYSDIDNTLSGDERFDVLRLLEGRTTNAKVLYNRFVERYNLDHAATNLEKPYKVTSSKEIEESQAPTLYQQAKTLLRQIYPQNTLLEGIESTCDDVHLYYEKHIKNKTYEEHERKTLAALIQRAELALDTYRDYSDKKANTYVNASALATCGAATFGVAVMSFPYFTSGMIVFATSYAGRTLTELMFKGERYRLNEHMESLRLAGIDGVTVAWGTTFRLAKGFRFLGYSRNALRIISKFALKKSLQKLNETQVKSIIMRSKESIHSRRHLETEKDLFLAEYGKLLHKEREKVIVGRMAAPRQSDSIENIFRRVGKKLISEQGSSDDLLASSSSE